MSLVSRIQFLSPLRLAAGISNLCTGTTVCICIYIATATSLRHMDVVPKFIVTRSNLTLHNILASDRPYLSDHSTHTGIFPSKIV
ncbi:hypothetical protein BT96DRAFT_602162 [Gymnopus androsaceus JB14]|uniref:Uncharacterized protein n=1 Tax=Gymnopus androsaceus JB14 TaxID=1447944 RepID=A0A6A4HTE9_9AGAR|nr:hypothetical protein BT96DRAFT_602162 [Gymnopus androsaceus JB14]